LAVSARRKIASGKDLHALFLEVFALQAVLAAKMDTVHEKAGLGTPQAKVMDALLRRGTATVPEIAADHCVSRQFVQTVCNGLELQGLISFLDNPRHRRSKLVSLTAAGRKVLICFRRAEAAFIESELRRFDAEEVATAAALLRNIRSRMERIRR
jgi:DNA-binding MarR family transcriptional regulator